MPRSLAAVPFSRVVESLRLFVLIFFAAAGTTSAHMGHDNQVEVRVFHDRMRLVFRTSLQVAWSVLGDRAPVMADEAGMAEAAPLLADAAASLFTVSQDGVVMAPVKAEGILEPDEHFAFVLNFGRPERWPVTVEARWFPPGGALDTTTFAVFDLSESPFARDIEPILKREIRSDRPAVTFDLAADAGPAAPVLAEALVVMPRRGRSWAWLTGSAVVTLLLLGGCKRLVRKP
jgi:hypothetical protein